MLSNLSQYSPQGLMPQFPGLQGAGWPQQMSPGLFGQPGANSGNASFGYESPQAGLTPQYSFGGQANAFPQQPFTPNQFWQSPLATNPYQGQLSQGPLHNPLGAFAGQPALHNPQHVIAVLGQLAQQFSIHSALTQQLGAALQQLAQQLAMQSYAGGFGASGGGQYFGQSPFAGAQGGLGGFNPQAQAWGASRSQTIQ
jgi:hypothetical protein